MLSACRQQSASGKPHQIHGVGVDAGLIEVVYSPDEAAIDIAPGAEVFNVEVADR